MNKEIKKEIKILIAAKYPIIYIQTWEEYIVEELLKNIAEELRKKIYFWSITTGFYTGKSEINVGVSTTSTINPISAFKVFMESKENAIYVFKDLHPFLKDDIIKRILKDAAKEVTKSKKNLIIVSTITEIPEELSKEITIMDFPLPDIEDLTDILDSLISTAKDNPQFKILLNEEEKERLIKAALGLTMTEAENVFARAIVNNNTLSMEDIDLIIKEKKQVIRKSGILEFIEVKEKIESIGGMENLKEWIVKRTRAFSEEAKRFGLPEPKGILLLGVQGCGKSLSAKVISSIWKLPLLRLDVGAIFGKYVGESEANIRKTISISESIAPVILWIDEIEKAFSGVNQSNDSGTSTRVFGTMLTWLQEKTKPVFVIATSNDISCLPPELIRKGRFDEIFFVDLPNIQERKQIFEIHLLKRNQISKEFDCEELAKLTEGFSGAEIEQVVISALYDAFDDRRKLEMKDLINSINKTVPLSVTAKEKIDWLRNWAKDRCVFASKKGNN